MIPNHWRETKCRFPRIVYVRDDGAAILKDCQTWSIRERIAAKPVAKRPTLDGAIAWADEHINDKETEV